jgi:MYXO-CTERM domain-containing protein
VYLLILGKPVLVWEVVLPLSLARPEPSQKKMWVSAASGRVLLEEEMVRSAGEAQVFAENPRATPNPIDVQIEGLLEAAPDAPLAGVRVNAYNCSTEELEELAPWHTEEDVEDGECYPGHRVRGDANADYFVTMPNIVLDADNKDPDDLYAELSMYYHAERFFGHMEDLGVSEFPCEISNMLANFHYLEPAPVYPDLDFGPLNNAYFTSQCNPEKGPTMIFGQGSEADFGFDGDVVYHELGHGIVRVTTAEGGLTTWKLRKDGSLRDARALNEAIADYHALMITEDPFMADYVGFYWTAIDKPYIRSAINENTCPANAAGQEHLDSEAFTAGLWATRERVGPKFDTVFLASLSMLFRDATLEEGVAALLDVADEQVADGEWTPEERELLFRAFEARGLVDCPRIITNPDDVLAGTKWYLRQNSQGVDPHFPGPVQIQTVVPPGSDNAILSFRIFPRGNSTGQVNETVLDTRVLVRRGAGGIEYEYTTVWLDQPGDEEGEIEVDEVIQVRGNWQMEVIPTELSEDERVAIVRGFEPGDVVTMTIVNLTYESQSIADDIFLTSVPAGELEGGSPFPDDGDPWELPEDDTGSYPDERVHGEDATGSCACDSTDAKGSGPGILAFGAFFVLAAGRLRRRRST